MNRLLLAASIVFCILSARPGLAQSQCAISKGNGSANFAGSSSCCSSDSGTAATVCVGKTVCRVNLLSTYMDRFTGVELARLKSKPTLSIEAEVAHCPGIAAEKGFRDPPFWVNRWRFECKVGLGKQWEDWLRDVNFKLSTHAGELLFTPGIASVHVVIYPDGTFKDVQVYTGSDRAFLGIPLTAQTNTKLTEILTQLGKVDPLPVGTKLKVMHLIVNGVSHVQ